MAVKFFLILFILTSLIFSLIYIPTNFNQPIPIFKPTKKLFITKTSSKPYPVTFAYLISASSGDTVKLKRLLKAIYHPGNFYLIHMDSGAPESDHSEIARYVSADPVFSEVGNVWIVGKPNLVTYRGPTMLATTLHAMAMLLRAADNWDWFINLSASDYPLVTQDGTASVSGRPSFQFFIWGKFFMVDFFV